MVTVKTRMNAVLLACVVLGVFAMMTISPVAFFVGIVTLTAAASLRRSEARAPEAGLKLTTLLDEHPAYDRAEFWRWN
jgi:hypothetical protein